MSLNEPLTPQNGSVLQVIAVCRISTVHQDEKSLDDQEALVRKYVSDNYVGSVNWTVIKSQGSGEYLDRKEILQLEACIESGEYDLVIAEDLSRLCRRFHAIYLCESCEDSYTRLIAINDRVDTIDANWRDNATMSTWHHERSNRDTSDRIRRSLKNRWINGGALERMPYGYIVPVGAKSDQEITKDPAAEGIYDEWFSMLEKGANYSDVADWLNVSGVPVGPYARSKKWDGRMVARVTKNAKLKGVREGSRQKSVRINKTGRRKSVRTSPDEWNDRECPNLAFIDPERYDQVLSLLRDRNANYARNGINGRDTRKNVSKKRTRFPGQMIFCGICGRNYVFGGHGQKHHLMCDGARSHVCWNGASVDGPLAAENIMAAVFQKIQSLPDFDDVFLAEIRKEINQIESGVPDERIRCQQSIEKLKREQDNFVDFIREGNKSEAVPRELNRIESELTDQRKCLKRLQKPAQTKLLIPTIEELKSLAINCLNKHAIESWEFRILIQKLIPKITVFPHQLCDGGGIVLRGRFRLQLGNLLENSVAKQALCEPLEQRLKVDFFNPPQREVFRSRILELRNPEGNHKKLTEKEIAEQLGLTVTATQRAAALQRKMDALGIDDPYLTITDPPSEGKLRRHLHPRYQFQPLSNAGEY